MMIGGRVDRISGITLAGLDLRRDRCPTTATLIDLLSLFDRGPGLRGSERLKFLDFALDQRQLPPKAIALFDLFVEPKAIRSATIAGHRHGGGADVDLRLAIEDALSDEAPAIDTRVHPRAGQSRVHMTLPGLADAGHGALLAHPATRPARGRIAVSDDQMHVAVSSITLAARMVDGGEVRTPTARHLVSEVPHELHAFSIGQFFRKRGHDLRQNAGIDPVLRLLGLDPTLGCKGLSGHPLGHDRDDGSGTTDIRKVRSRRPERMGAAADRTHMDRVDRHRTDEGHSLKSAKPISAQ